MWGQTWPGLSDSLGGEWWFETVKCWVYPLVPPANFIRTDKLGLLWIAEETYRTDWENRQANTDKHLNLIQTISLCLLQEAHSDRSKRPGGCINGSGGWLPVSLVHSHSPRLSLPFSLSGPVKFAVNDLRRTLTHSLRPCSLWAAVSRHLATPSLSLCCLSLRIYAVSLCVLQGNSK